MITNRFSDGQLKIVRFCAIECELQVSGERSVFWMVRAWNHAMDPSAQWTYSGTPSGAGAVMTWKGDKMGQGTLTLTNADPQHGVAYSTVIEDMTPAHGTFAFEAGNTRTKVVWVDEGTMGMNLVGRYFLPIFERTMAEQLPLTCLSNDEKFWT